MQHRRHTIYLFAFILLSGLLSADTPSIRVLGIGNSFTRNSTKYLPQIIESDSAVSAEIGLAYIGGCSIDKHVTLAEAHEANPEKGNKYKYSINGHTVKPQTSLKQMLLDGKWDTITIQQVSSKSYKIETYYPYTEKLINTIRKYSPDSKIVIHETWSHSIDSPRTKDWNLHPDVMYTQLHAAYGQIAEEFQLDIIPVGTAFQNAKKRPLWNHQAPTFDVDKLVYPEDKNNLPDQSKSLHHTFSWRSKDDGSHYVNKDGYHAGKFGEYLGALVWYEFFFNKDARTVDYTPDGFTEAQAISLREVAHETMSAQPAMPANETSTAAKSKLAVCCKTSDPE